MKRVSGTEQPVTMTLLRKATPRPDSPTILL